MEIKGGLVKMSFAEKVPKDFFKTLFKTLFEPGASLPLARVGSILTEQGIQAYVVGGFVRDVLLGRDTADIDIAVASDALEIAPEVATALNGKYVLLDKVNRVGRVVLASKATLDFSTFKGSIEQDLARRDFTINAMATDLNQLGENYRDVQLVDPFNGRGDLEQGIVRSVAEAAFESDPARLLRAVRLAAELGFSIEQKTEAQIRQYSQLIASVAGERVREELVRLLAVSGSAQFLPYLDKLGLLTAIIPELAQSRGVEQPNEHFWDVLSTLSTR